MTSEQGSAFMASPLGPLRLRWREHALEELRFARDEALVQSAAGGNAAQPPAWLAQQLEAYFQDPGHVFDLPIRPAGTAFQQQGWQALRRIPPGSVLTYGELAAVLGSGARAVGGACRANPCPIVVPCHRVVAKGGLGGFAGASAGGSLAIKAWLLRHEGRTVREFGI
jgi:methylated-DNA-[protein]-cysteine S-methyltransferase